MEKNYNVKIYESSREFNARERIAMKDLTNAIKFDSVIADDHDKPIVIKPVDWAVLEIHNSKAEKDMYFVYVIINSEGNKYYTSSAAFWNSFIEIVDEMAAENDNDFSIEVYKCESKNYKGKYFITCGIVL